jgi:hypothetical protein
MSECDLFFKIIIVFGKLALFIFIFSLMSISLIVLKSTLSI